MKLTDMPPLAPQAARELAKHFPPAGTCEVCGGPDKRHRLWDTLIGRSQAGESVESIAKDYGLSLEAVLGVLRWQPYQGRAGA